MAGIRRLSTLFALLLPYFDHTTFRHTGLCSTIGTIHWRKQIITAKERERMIAHIDNLMGDHEGLYVSDWVYQTQTPVMYMKIENELGWGVYRRLWIQDIINNLKAKGQ